MELIRDGKTEIIECHLKAKGTISRQWKWSAVCGRFDGKQNHVLDETLSIMQTMDALRKQWA